MADPAQPRVSILFPNQYGEAAAVLGRAFVDDPLIKAILPPIADAVERARRMGELFNVILRGHRGDGQPVLGVMHEGRVGAVAVVEQVAQAASAASVVIHGLPLLPPIVKTAGWSGTKRALAALDTLTRNRPREQHVYLNILGVEPALQGRHFGVAILDFLREQAAARSELAGVYLETATEANVAYYSRLGYGVIGEIFPIGVRMWRMLQPRAL